MTQEAKNQYAAQETCETCKTQEAQEVTDSHICVTKLYKQ